MIQATQLRRGMCIKHQDELFRVMETTHLTPGNKRGMIQTSIRNLRSGAIFEHQFRSDDRIERAILDDTEMEFLYQDGDMYHFMNNETFEQIALSKEVLEEATDYLIPNGIVDRIRFIVYVDPAQYARLSLPSEKLEIARAVGRINRVLHDERFILMGPGRWGTSNLDLGVKVTYADIFNTRMLIELGYTKGAGTPEVSHGTHFFQDLVEARIFPLAVFPDRAGITFNRRFLNEAPNHLAWLVPRDAALEGVIKVIDVPAARNGQLLEVTMSADKEEALARFRYYD